jgi:ligand-binding sensor domain-containing protein
MPDHCIGWDSPLARALDPHFSLTQYTHRIWFTQQGFTQGTVQRIFQGPDGYLWLDTQRGLVRFDGVKFTPAESLFPTLPANLWVRSGLEDESGGIWIGTSDAGVFYLKDQEVTPYSIRQGERSFQWRIASAAHAVPLSAWQEVHGLGTLYFSVITGVMNLKVCA